MRASLASDPRASLSPSGGTSAAAPFVTGTVALLWSEFPTASATELLLSVRGTQRPRLAIVPPLLDAWSAHEFMLSRDVQTDLKPASKEYRHKTVKYLLRSWPELGGRIPATRKAINKWTVEDVRM